MNSPFRVCFTEFLITLQTFKTTYYLQGLKWYEMEFLGSFLKNLTIPTESKKNLGSASSDCSGLNEDENPCQKGPLASTKNHYIIIIP